MYSHKNNASNILVKPPFSSLVLVGGESNAFNMKNNFGANKRSDQD